MSYKISFHHCSCTWIYKAAPRRTRDSSVSSYPQMHAARLWRRKSVHTDRLCWLQTSRLAPQESWMPMREIKTVRNKTIFESLLSYIRSLRTPSPSGIRLQRNHFCLQRNHCGLLQTDIIRETNLSHYFLTLSFYEPHFRMEQNCKGNSSACHRTRGSRHSNRCHGPLGQHYKRNSSTCLRTRGSRHGYTPSNCT